MTISSMERTRTARKWSPSLGAWPDGEATRFRVWAPAAQSVEVVLERFSAETVIVSLARASDGTFSGLVPNARAGDRYRYRIDGAGPFPDPVSRFQPEGVHGPSEIVDPGRFVWSDRGWRGLRPEELVIYELHVGTFSPAGTFKGAMCLLESLRDL